MTRRFHLSCRYRGRSLIFFDCLRVRQDVINLNWSVSCLLVSNTAARDTKFARAADPRDLGNAAAMDDGFPVQFACKLFRLILSSADSESEMNTTPA